MEPLQEVASPSTPRAQAQRNLIPVTASQPTPMQIDHPTLSNNAHMMENAASNSAAASVNLPDGVNEDAESDNQKEVWKKRKQM